MKRETDGPYEPGELTGRQAAAATVKLARCLAGVDDARCPVISARGILIEGGGVHLLVTLDCTIATDLWSHVTIGSAQRAIAC